MILVKQRNFLDCAIASIATFCYIPYEDALARYASTLEAVPESWEEWFTAHRISTSDSRLWLSPMKAFCTAESRSKDWKLPLEECSGWRSKAVWNWLVTTGTSGVLAVNSLNYPGALHCVVYDGQGVLDPSNSLTFQYEDKPEIVDCTLGETDFDQFKKDVHRD